MEKGNPVLLVLMSWSVLAIIFQPMMFAEEPRSASTIQDVQAEKNALTEPQNNFSKTVSIPDSLELPSPLTPVKVATENVPNFLDLSFPESLSGKKFQISSHESVSFKSNELKAEAYGSTLTLNLYDQKLVSVTFIGYVLGPFYPAHDYLNTYFQTVEALEKLIEKAIQRSPEVPLIARHRPDLESALETLKIFCQRAERLKKDSDFRFETDKLTEAVEDLYDGRLPEHLELHFEPAVSSHEKIWKAEICFNHDQKPDVIQNRLVVFKDLSGEYAISEIQDRNYKNDILIKESYQYDSYRTLTQLTMESFYASGQLKISSKLLYNGEEKTHRYYDLYDENGTKLRHLIETFYSAGRVKASSDYRYTIGKKYFQKFTPDGKQVLAYASRIQL